MFLLFVLEILAPDVALPGAAPSLPSVATRAKAKENSFAMADAAESKSTAGRDDRKSAAIADASAKPLPGYGPVNSFSVARDLLRSPSLHQSGVGAEFFANMAPERVPVFFLDRELHRKRRAQIARYFTPRAIIDRHQMVMKRTTAELMEQLQRSGREQLDVLSLRLACDVVAELVGPTNSDPSAMAHRLRKKFLAGTKAGRGGLRGQLGKSQENSMLPHNLCVSTLVPQTKGR